jgi:hypothetical protein
MTSMLSGAGGRRQQQQQQQQWQLQRIGFGSAAAAECHSRGQADEDAAVHRTHSLLCWAMAMQVIGQHGREEGSSLLREGSHLSSVHASLKARSRQQPDDNVKAPPQLKAQPTGGWRGAHLLHEACTRLRMRCLHPCIGLLLLVLLHPPLMP